MQEGRFERIKVQVCIEISDIRYDGWKDAFISRAMPFGINESADATGAVCASLLRMP